VEFTSYYKKRDTGKYQTNSICVESSNMRWKLQTENVVICAGNVLQ